MTHGGWVLTVKMRYFKASKIQAYWNLKAEKKLWWRPNSSPLSVPRGWIFLPEEKNIENWAARRSHRDPGTRRGTQRNLREKRTELRMVWGRNEIGGKKLKLRCSKLEESFWNLQEGEAVPEVTARFSSLSWIPLSHNKRLLRM